MKASALAILFALSLYPAQAQDHQHESSATDGSRHPELVSDTDAYRHFFLINQTRNEAILGFRTEWANRIAAYNAKATALNRVGQRADLKQFMAGRDLLVQQTRDELKRTLGERQMAAIDGRVQALKRTMGVSGVRQVAVKVQKQLIPAAFRPQGGGQGPCVTYSDSLAGSWSMAMASTPSGGNGSSFSMSYTVLVDGGVTMTINPQGCGLNPPNYSNIVHTPTASITVGGHNASSTGPGVCGDCYISVQINPTFSQVIGVPVDGGPGGSVDCSFGGIFFSWFPSLQFEGAFTFVKNTEPLNPLEGDCETPSNPIWIDGKQYSNQQVCYYSVTNWCTNTPDADYSAPFYIALAVADVQGVSPATGGMKGWWLNFWIPIYRVLNGSGQPITGWFNPIQLASGGIYLWYEVLENNLPFVNQLQFTMLSQPSTSYTYPKGVCTAATPSSSAFVAQGDPIFD